MKEQEDENVFEDRSDDELVYQSGLSAPYAELLRRNTEALKESSEAEKKYSNRILLLTVVLFAIAVVEFMLQIVPMDDIRPWLRYAIALTLFGMIIYFLRIELKKDDW